MAVPKPSVNGTPFEGEEWNGFVRYLQDEAKGDKPVVWNEVPRWDMSNVHLFFFELFERVYLFAEYAVQHDDLVSYLGFAEVVLFNIYKHHDSEETLYYPRMAEAAGVDHWSVNVQEHRLFDQNLEAALVYVRLCRQNLQPTPPLSPVPEPTADLISAYDKFPALNGKKAFDASLFRNHLDQIISVFGKHMTDEIETLTAEKVALVGQKEYAEIDDKLVAHLRDYGPEWFLCIAFAAMPMHIFKQLLPMPFIIRKVLVPLWWGPKFAAWWKYCPYPENLWLFGPT